MSLLLLLLFLASPLPADVDVTPLDGARLLAVTVPGELLDVAAACVAERCHGLLLLTAPAAGGPTALLRLDPEDPSTLGTLADDLPVLADTLVTVDVDGDGRLEVLVGEPGRLYRAGTIGQSPAITAPRLLVESRELDLERLVFEPGRFTVAEVGSLVSYTTDGKIAGRYDLPVRAARGSTGLRLTTLPVTRLEVDAGTVWAVGPEAHGNRRLRTVLIAEGGAESEAWSMLPGPEAVISSWYTALGGRPALVVTTVSAEKIGIFEKKKLRVFAIRADRSRSGLGPAFKADTVSHHWQEADVNVADVDGDGRLDLVVVQPSGLGGKKLIAEAYLGRTGAQLHRTALRSVVQAERPGVWHYGADVDGDGTADLVTRSGRLVQVFPGLATPKKQLLAKKARWRLELEARLESTRSVAIGADSDDDEGEDEDIRGRPKVVDVDGDGRAEVLVWADGKDADVLWVIDPD